MPRIATCRPTVRGFFGTLLLVLLFVAAREFVDHPIALAQSVKSLTAQCKKDYAIWKDRAGYAAFAASKDGRCGWSFYFDSAAEARKQALAGCKRQSCRIIAEIGPVSVGAAHKRDCKNARGKKRIAACTWLIETAKVKGYELAETLHFRGDAHFYEQLQFELAIADYTAAISADKTFAWPHFNRARLLQRQGKLSQALADVEAALRKFKPHDGCLPPICDLRKEAQAAAQELKRQITEIAAANPETLCRRVLAADKTTWNPAQPYAVAQALDRGLKIASCRVALGYRAEFNPYESRPVERVCGDALDEQRVNWHADRLHAGDEAKRRGETIETCRTKLALPPLAAPADAVASEGSEPSFIITEAEEVDQPRVALDTGQKRIALVIGNADYAVGSLPNPGNDAQAIASALRALGFGVIEGENLGRREMQHKVVEFEAKARDADIALFFYAGHAVQLQDRNYLIPVDATIEGETALRFESVELDLVAATMTDGGAAGVVLLDACRDNPFKSKLSATRGLTVGDGLAAPSFLSGGLLYGFATTPGEVALDGKGEHSPFTAALLKHLPSKGLEIEQVLKDVSIEVAEATGGRQIPWRNTNLRTKLYLNP